VKFDRFSCTIHSPVSISCIVDTQQCAWEDAEISKAACDPNSQPTTQHYEILGSKVPVALSSGASYYTN